jgi:hypothetical protein
VGSEAGKSTDGAGSGTWGEACGARFSKWKQHEDEFLRFSFPDDPRVGLEIKSPGDVIPVEGEPLRSGDVSFFRCYRLTFKNETYCLLLLDRSGDFDNSICFCGHVAFEKYLEHGGAWCRFSLLENGQVKRIQILGDGLRLVLFEWTHLPIHQEVYSAIGLGVRMRKPVPDLSAMRKRIERSYGKTGFLEKGMSRDEVIALLGPPTSEDARKLRYVSRLSHDDPPGSQLEEVTYRIPLTKGVFLGLSPHWSQRRGLPPEPNSVQWVLGRLGDQWWQGEPLDLADDRELRPLLDRVVGWLPKAGERHWGMLCRAAALLAQRGVKDSAVLSIIRQRYLDPELSAGEASDALREYDPEGSPSLLAKRIQVEMALARRPQTLKEREDLCLDTHVLEDLFRYLPKDFSQRETLILEAMDHPHAAIRMVGYGCEGDLPESVARQRLRKGLGDSCAQIRVSAAQALVEMHASEADNKEDLRMLKAQLAKETDRGVITDFDEVIKRLE